ncbi:gamma carbonic anhydrase family protein [Candidatus Xianfuyuplasma coldseepsis]|uniref:Gamma carbonic anhydrase family protein n=1 Tax=Candidatus Xianfuyuplasma coldseepsis TaxID=2782163 RepID=A0A7L7KNH2_9MOLU|nr:gamma carbonic anhydrase family protein [Xianfuyuplasma coldseepsis]QMS84203.1 gamma carbonic anhydrase family protein [Xianfuyuplasma coldseepsis]
MSFEQYKHSSPTIASTAKIFDSAVIAGDVTIKDYVNIWFNVSIRGDMAPVTIGENTNIQDNAVVHTNTNLPTVIGRNVTVGHGAIIHACTVEDNCLIGMGSILLDGCIIGTDTLIGAGALIPPGKHIPSGVLVVGNPMRIVRDLTIQEKEAMKANKDAYITLMKNYI